ncbi:hypothetical protein [Nonomuraea endophytica]|uniref:Uncharacterized protein n=1 Tax=Nonomuraea endophytica TaxID=714136 RepID=A0A7W8ADB3_9ACTN|nr:hypothetical protein [Nonomuraea endophytica]MBB5084182.1 hypothetical protein [Nonomuraea endophytica]
MSFDLAVWFEDEPITPMRATAKFLDWCEEPSEDHSSPDPRAEVAAFLDELTARYPDLTADNYAGSPWAEPLTVAEDIVLASAVFPRAAEVCRTVFELAGRHGLLVFDPQSGSLHVPQR